MSHGSPVFSPAFSSNYMLPPPPGLPIPPHLARQHRPRGERPDFDLGSDFGAPLGPPPGQQSTYRPPQSPPPLSPSEFPSIGHDQSRSRERQTGSAATKLSKTKEEKKRKKANLTENAHESKKRKGTGGRTKGSTTYSALEEQKLVDLVRECEPIGGKAWDALTALYNDWAKDNNVPRRTRQPLNQKWTKVRVLSPVPIHFY